MTPDPLEKSRLRYSWCPLLLKVLDPSLESDMCVRQLTSLYMNREQKALTGVGSDRRVRYNILYMNQDHKVTWPVKLSSVP